MYTQRPLVVGALCALSLAVSCGKARLSASGEIEEPTGDRQGGAPDAGADETGIPVSDEPYTPPEGELGCVLIPSVGGDIFVALENSVEIGVYVYSLETGAPMPDSMVSFAVLEDESVEARLSALNVRSDPDGLAKVQVTAGTEAGLVVVRAVTECANSLDIEIDVLDLPVGDLRVSFNYPFRDVYDVAPIEVEIFLPDTLRCRDFRPGEIPVGSIRSASAASVDGAVVIESLMVDFDYTVIAVGLGTYGERAAQGCADNVNVRERRETEERIDLYLLPLDPVGLYEVTSHWDFTDAIADSGPVGEMLVEILDIFEDPGRGIQDFLLGLVEDFVGGLIAGTIELFLDLTGLDDVISDAINDLINSSPLLSDIFTIGNDIRSIIAELEVISELEIGKLGSDYEVFGVDRWTGIALYWRLDCPDGAPPDCGRIPIDFDVADLGLLRGEWTGRVLGYNHLDIDRHPVDFEYGRLILYVMEYLVLPAMTGDPAPVTLEDVMYGIFNCPGIGDWVAGGDGDCRCALGACICDADVEGFCEDFIDLVFGTIFRGFVDALSFDAVLDLRGSCTLVNEDELLDVDRLADGEYIGNISINGSSTPFVTTFSGVRIGD